MSDAVFGLGAMLHHRAGLARPGRWRWSPAHGDLRDPAACQSLRKTLADWLADPDQAPLAFAHDRHPDFYSSQLARELAAQHAVPALAVQHHHAHIAAVVAQHSIKGAVLGVALDGFGWGADDTAWGGEILLVQHHRWSRLAHLQGLPMPGGDQATRQPWRLALACAAIQRLDPAALALRARVLEADEAVVRRMLERGFHCPPSTSAGRWFDAMAALLGLCAEQSDEVEAARLLESAAARYLADGAHAGAEGFDPDRQDWGYWVQGIESELPIGVLVADLLAQASGSGASNPGSDAGAGSPSLAVQRAAAAFHLGLAEGLVKSLRVWAQRCAITQVCLSGGCLANRILRERLCAGLAREGLEAWLMDHGEHGDISLALGQAFVAQSWLREHAKRQAAASPDSDRGPSCATLQVELAPHPWEDLLALHHHEGDRPCALRYLPA